MPDAVEPTHHRRGIRPGPLDRLSRGETIVAFDGQQDDIWPIRVGRIGDRMGMEKLSRSIMDEGEAKGAELFGDPRPSQEGYAMTGEGQSGANHPTHRAGPVNQEVHAWLSGGAQDSVDERVELFV
jgi:hypothetical protein